MLDKLQLQHECSWLLSRGGCSSSLPVSIFVQQTDNLGKANPLPSRQLATIDCHVELARFFYLILTPQGSS